MNAWKVYELGDYRDVLKWEECDQPKPEGSEALIKVKAIGLNFPDILGMAGKHQSKTELPFIPGQEGAGEVVEVGPDCEYKVGDRLMTMGKGAFAEYWCAKKETTFKVPDGMTDVDAAAFQMIYQTSYFGLRIRANLQPGEVLLVHAGAGGVGTAAIQLGKIMGATVIATAGSDVKLDICRQCGADHVINYEKDDIVQSVKDLTDGKGADVIYDPVGGDVFDKSSKCINWNGRIVIVGFTSGRIAEIKTNRILLKNMSVTGLFWGAYRIHQPHLIREAQEVLYGYYAAGDLKPVIYNNYPLKELPDALDAISTRASYGKVVLTP
jgi:NADPH2:quinone reductase